LVVADLHDKEGLRRAVARADVVYHCAAKVGDWGPWRLFQREVIDATGNMLGACRAEGVGRLVHVSSITVYGRPTPRAEPFNENEPLGQKLGLWDYYIRAKMAAEEQVRNYGGNWSILRPGWMYGPRDRNTLPRAVKAIEVGRVSLMGSGENMLNILHAGDVAAGAILAASSPAAIGQAYNFASTGEITQRQLLDLLTDLLGKPRVRWRVPYRVAYWTGFLSEVIGRLIFLKRPPYITRYAVSLIGRPTLFSTAKARAQLGWQPRIGIQEGLRETLAWYFESIGRPAPAL
jgi:nucleoside-diphosphate-sugar epimerase